MCHRQSLFDEMHLLSEQMSINRQESVAEVVSFINRQAYDAHQQAKELLDDAIQRILKAKEKIFNEIERNRRTKIRRLEKCLKQFDQDAVDLQTNLSQQICLSASTLVTLRRQYAFNMFNNQTESMRIYENQRDQFFDNYRHFEEMMCLREKWPFLQDALTTVYFTATKKISLDQILTLLEYRHDRVIENYRDYLLSKEETKNHSIDELFHQLSFLPRQIRFEDKVNFIELHSESEEKMKR